jgi:hypothetical protein
VAGIDKKGLCFALDRTSKVGIRMTFETLIIWEDLFIENAADFMWLVTFNTAGNLMRPFFPQFTPYNLAMYILDLGVALHTGSGNPSAIDTRLRIFVRQDIMGCMAAGANRGDD